MKSLPRILTKLNAHRRTRPRLTKKVNPFLRFAYDASRNSRSRPVRRTEPSESRLGKRKESIEASESEEKDKPKVRRTAVQNKSPLKASGSSKVRVYEYLRGIDDNLDVGLDIVFCGINPGKKSAEIGHHFGNPNNHFWSCLHESGLTSRRLDPREDASLPKLFSMGLTNLTDRPTATETELSKTEQVGGVPALLGKLAQYRPRILCFVGLGIADIVKSRALAVGTSGARKTNGSKEKAVVGLQPYKMVHSELGSNDIHETLFFAVSCTSGRVVRYQKSDKVRQFQELHDLLNELKCGRIDTTAMASVKAPLAIIQQAKDDSDQDTKAIVIN
ncbi:hypothetical protein GALMADRAFT_450914 [Galerina marginata CBS 339.88]|uniref:Uracil-DNA glycosylase-like domain-containing protein n=1 Tax=Galerina marginata (strain CBS 339.88) TaxID=685588 RepID=A0A067TC54_GALM3|nr:hypothetical protein GALMADRAFT_450914 [Galerina marginata CBS 339.88]